MKRILIFLALLLAAYVSFSQSPIYGRLRVISGLYDNYFQNGTDTFKLGWRTDRFQLKYNTNKRFIDLIKSDSTVIIYNKLILTSPNDTLLSVRGGGMNVVDGSVLFTGTTGTTPASGEGTRLMWIPEKAAFRAGYVDGTQWDADSIGLYSFAFGNNTKASGAYSLSEGWGNISSGVGSHTEGGVYDNKGNIACGLNTASGYSSHAEGALTIASGDQAHAEGNSSVASGSQSHAEGTSVASGSTSHSEGSSIASGNKAHSEGTSIASGIISHAEGSNSIASGDISHAGGQSNIANSYLLFVTGILNDTTFSTDKINWVSTDPLFQIGNGANSNSRNDAFRILKNGKTYIGDSSSVTDAILIVDPTDSTSNFIGKVIIKNSTDTALSVRGTSRFNGDMFPQQNIMLLNTTNASKYGIIYKDGYTFIHDFNYGNNGVVTTEGYNTFVGLNSGNLTMGATATNVRHSSYNVGLGFVSLTNNTTGQENTAIGSYSLANNSTGYSNTAVGTWSLYENTTGNNNTVLGVGAGSLNKTGSNNLFVGNYAGYWGNWNYKGFIDVIDRGDSASQLTSSPIIIDFNAVPTSQWITNNANVKVNEGSVLFSGTTGTTPASGAGTRLMWIPEKAAFRAGEVDGTQWDADSIEFYSFAVGYNTKATKEGAFAVGSTSSATGIYSYAFGTYNTASGSHSIANGNFSTASGDNSYSNGYNILASGDFSFANGAQTVANSRNLSVFGQYNDTTISTSEMDWVSTDPLFQIGNGTEESKRNDAFRILKNGKTFIGDSSSVTDAILIVDPTDSTVTQLGMVKRTYVLTVNDDANLVLPDDFAGWVEVSALNSGTEDEYASFRINSDGTIAGLTFNTANVTLVLGTDGNLNIGTTSTKGVIENKLGGSRDFIVRIEGKLYLGM